MKSEHRTTDRVRCSKQVSQKCRAVSRSKLAMYQRAKQVAVGLPTPTCLGSQPRRFGPRIGSAGRAGLRRGRTALAATACIFSAGPGNMRRRGASNCAARSRATLPACRCRSCPIRCRHRAVSSSAAASCSPAVTRGSVSSAARGAKGRPTSAPSYPADRPVSR